MRMPRERWRSWRSRGRSNWRTSCARAGVVPSWIERLEIREQVFHRHPVRHLLVLGDVADLGERFRAECARIDAEHLGMAWIGRRMFIRILMVVVLPAPLGPARPKTLPSGTFRFRPSSTRTLRKRLARSTARK